MLSNIKKTTAEFGLTADELLKENSVGYTKEDRVLLDRGEVTYFFDTIESVTFFTEENEFGDGDKENEFGGLEISEIFERVQGFAIVLK